MNGIDIYAPGAGDELVRRIESWRSTDVAQWGKLDAIHAVVHCQAPLRVGLGELRIDRTWIGRLFGGLARRSLRNAKPTARNLPTDPHFLDAPKRDFAGERAVLIELVRRFVRAGPAGLPKQPHPFFGPLTSAEWSALMAKHLDHHLRQFGR